MKNRLASGLGIVGIVMLVGCGGGSDTTLDTTNSDTVLDIVSDTNLDTVSDIVSDTVSDTTSSNEDILTITKQSNTAFTIEWDKNYTLIFDGVDSGIGRSSIGYVEWDKDPDSAEQYIQVLATHELISEFQITCSKWMDEDLNGKVVFRCDGIITYPEGNTVESTSYIRIYPNLTYYFGRRYSTTDPLELDEWQGPDYEVSYTSDGTLTIE